MCKAVRERLAKGKLSTTPYDVKRAHAEFPFIRLDFIPSGSADATEHEGGNLNETRDTQPPPKDPNVVHIRISVPSSLRTPSSTAPPAVPTHPKPRPILGESVNTNSMPTLLHIPPSTPGNSRLTIRLPAGVGKENYNPEAATSITTDVSEDKTVKRTFCLPDYHEAIINMIERHYCAHPLIPGYSHPSPEGIRAWAVKQMYEYCVENDLWEVWAYLWENWYRPGRWELWARSCHPEIPVLKTTMILESQ
jgi:hypothetical protein